MFLIDYIEPLYFFISLCIGILITYITVPEPEIIYKFPTPENTNSVVYRDNTNNCYKYISKEVSCPNNKKKVYQIPIIDKFQ